MARAFNILLIEDNDDDAFLFKTSVRRLYLTVTHVRDAASAIQQLSSGEVLPDLIVLDLTLPGMTSTQFLDWAKSMPILDKIPICIYTGASEIADTLKKSVRGAFFKSSVPSEIRGIVEQMCGDLLTADH